MASQVISLSVQLASVLLPQAVAIWKAIAELKEQGIPQATIDSLVLELSADAKASNAQAVGLVAGIPPPASG